MFYLKTYQGNTEQKKLNRDTCLVRDLFLDWEICEVELPVYVYEHLEEYMEHILAYLDDRQRHILQLWYERDILDDQWVCQIAETLKLSFDDVVDVFFEGLRKLREASDDLYYLSYGAHKNFPLSKDWDDADDGEEYIDRWIADGHRIKALRKQIVKEVDAYANGLDTEFLYLPKIFEKQTISKEGMGADFDPEQPMEEMDLSVRAYNCLYRAGVRNVGQIMELDEEALDNVRNLKGKSRKEVEELQIDIRSGWFFRQDKNIFDCKFPADLMELLLTHGYFFWNGMKNEVYLIDKLLKEAGLEKYRKPFADFAQEQSVKEASNSEKVVLTFQKNLDVHWMVRYHINMTEELRDYFREGAVLYPAREHLLKAAREDKFNALVSKMAKTGDNRYQRVLRILVGASDYAEVNEGAPLMISERLMNYMAGSACEENPPIVLVASVCHRKDADYIIGVPDMEEWEYEQTIKPIIFSGQLYFHRIPGMTDEEWENTLWVRAFFPKVEKSWYYRELNERDDYVDDYEDED